MHGVSIIIDRIDLYEGQLKFITVEIVRMMNALDKNCYVKVFMIAETNLGRGDWHEEYLPEGDPEHSLGRIFIKKNWNQQRKTPQELSSGHWPLAWSD